MMPANQELDIKLSALRSLLTKHDAEAILLRRVSSFAWATCGAKSYVNTATTEGAASLLITREKAYLATNNIEAPRLEHEEGLRSQGWEFIVSPWETPQQALNKTIAGKNLISDVPFANAKDVGAEICRLRARLTPRESERFVQLGSLCAEIMSATAQVIKPGMSEFKLAAVMGKEAQERNVQPIVNLVATDDRTYRFRHPLPTNKMLEKYAMLVLSGRWGGLVCSISRLVYFGKVPQDLMQRIQATAYVNAVLISHSRIGNRLQDILALGKAAYAETGFPDEWRHHHQGGVIGYEPREYLATSEAEDYLVPGQALAWNPTIAGAKMEDSIIVDQNSIRNLTVTPLWPVEPIKILEQSGTVLCALALEL